MPSRGATDDRWNERTRCGSVAIIFPLMLILRAVHLMLNCLRAGKAKSIATRFLGLEIETSFPATSLYRLPSCYKRVLATL